MTLDPNAKATLEPVRSSCKLCGANLLSKTAQYCVECVRKHTRKCSTCRDHAGRLLAEYQRHKPVGNTAEHPVCTKCGTEHDWYYQKDCPQCHGDRVVVEMPGEKE